MRPVPASCTCHSTGGGTSGSSTEVPKVVTSAGPTPSAVYIEAQDVVSGGRKPSTRVDRIVFAAHTLQCPMRGKLRRPILYRRPTSNSASRTSARLGRLSTGRR